MKSPVIWLTACSFLLVLCQSVALEHGSAVFELLTSDCPTEPVNAEAVAAPSEPECSLLCTLSSECRLSVYLTDRAVCYRLSAMPSSTGSCGSRMVARRKLLSSETTPSNAVTVGPSAPTSATPASSLSEASVIQNLSSNFVLWYNFKKSFNNFVNQSVYQAEPVNVTEQSPVDGVRLQGSSGSYVKVSTAGFSKYFAFGKQYSMFFQGKFSCNSVVFGGNFINVHNNLLIGSCMSAAIQPFDGWLQCWALLTGNLDAAQFDQLRNVCSL
uniref:Apple domain-containing protein n=1 Tax=Macrostomum lignano TaxID=282301 RepID=A0A1I8IEP9_9PLAT